MIAKTYKLPKWAARNVPEKLLESNLFRFKVKFLNGHEAEIDLMADLGIDYEDLEQTLEEAPVQYMYWAAVYSELKSTVTFLEAKVARRRAVVTKEVADQYRVGGIKLTDKQLLILIEADDKLAKLQFELAMAHKNAGKLWHMVEATRMRSEHCRSLAGFKRQDKEQSVHQT